MKLATAQKPVEVVGEFENNEFHVELNSQAYSALSSGIYSDKIGAVIRELSTNAYDAHIDANNPAPFMVHLPTRNEPYFSIRDYGIGLSHEDVMKMYTTYFHSTKTNTNSAVGCFGLGSKSPFAYTDSFTVVSYFNGKKRTYNIYKQYEVPQIAIVKDNNGNPYEEDTNEHNGLEVSIPVSPNDFYNFESTARNIYRYFAQSPTVTGHYSIKKFEKVQYDLTFKVPGVTPSQPEINVCLNTANDGCYVIMGNVRYRIKLPVGVVPSKLQHIEKLQLDIYLNIGDVDVNISREALSYVPRTCSALSSVFSNIVLYAKNKIESELKSPKNLWEAAIQLRSIRSNSNILFKICPAADIKWKGVEIPLDIPVDIRDVTIISYNLHHYRKNKISGRHQKHTIVPSPQTLIVLRDIKTSFNERCRQNLASGKVEQIYMFSPEDKNADLNAIKAEIIKALNCSDADIIMCSSLAYNPAVANKTGRGGFGKSLLEFDGAYARLYQCWSASTDDVSKGCYYVPVSNNYIAYRLNSGNDKNANTHPRTMESWLEALKMLGFKIDKVYGIRYNKLSQIENDPKYINVGKLLDSELKKYINDPVRVLDLQYAKLLNDTWRGFDMPGWYNNRITTKDSDLQKFLDSIKIARDAHTKYKDICSKIQLWTGINIDKDSAKKSLESLKSKVNSKYPMLRFVANDSYHDVQQYINLIEK